MIDKSREAVWNAAVPELGRQFFVINTIDKNSGLVNVSYAGDPEKYVDCGEMSAFVKNARGERNYDFPVARANVTHELITDGIWLKVDRTMELEGRMNLVFEEVGPNQTRVSANTRYVVKRVLAVVDVNGRQDRIADSVSFNSNSSGQYPTPPGAKEGITCVPTGVLEREVLSVIR